ncbi:PKHD-type hydroxylase [Altererythrobacter xixiisoli]|uniref:PKHD-type hydroxylase n=1 Tax=Croceibacterium xixiisoli TaxID=1476466 RepID=A0A6I4TPJ0_9SPHN|nr:PKHD-type hydroxylase [Croceibacterium xixiisoli]
MFRRPLTTSCGSNCAGKGGCRGLGGLGLALSLARQDRPCPMPKPSRMDNAMLLTIPNVLTADVARTVRDRVNASRTLNVPLDMHQRGAAETGQTHDDGWLVRSIQAELTTALMDNAAFLSAALPHSLQEPRFERCCVGEVPGPHRRPLATTTGGPRGDLTATLFLTDPEEYDGGELEVEGSFGRLGFRLPAGHMVLFPTDSRHRTTPVTRGERVSCSFAVQSLVGDHSARETLYDLDRTVQALGAERGKGDVHVLRLAGIHYSLVRRWAEA